MADEVEKVVENVRRVTAEVEEARSKYRSSDDRVRIMAVTKTVPPELVNAALECGIPLLGENRVQEYLRKKDAYKAGVPVHFIGQLQQNKVRQIMGLVNVIQSVDSLRLAAEIDRQARRLGITAEIFIEVNIGREPSKGGVLPEALSGFLSELTNFSNFMIRGLMTIPPKGNAEKFFYEMQKLFIDNRGKSGDNIDICELSMGMSNDFSLAVQYGATMVRIGTGLFGTRK